jgi:hypothetical protein
MFVVRGNDWENVLSHCVEDFKFYRGKLAKNILNARYVYSGFCTLSIYMIEVFGLAQFGRPFFLLGFLNISPFSYVTLSFSPASSLLLAYPPFDSRSVYPYPFRPSFRPLSSLERACEGVFCLVCLLLLFVATCRSMLNQLLSPL